MKTLATLSLAALGLAVSLAPASAEDRSVTVYTGAGGITVPASALAAPQPARKAATDVAPARNVRVVLASPYRAMN
ncbi:hypothetical protein ACFQE0_17490 [Methylobacterium komagatae]|uniref:Tripartite tricarboxylate transporter substrate binding protein n=1 Tax=Methylobacterium komagatae TaxID=374425 RepID=A0ABW2BLF3_9HYPH